LEEDVTLSNNTKP